MAKFKIGDEVVCVVDNSDCWYRLGDKLIISSEPFVEDAWGELAYNIEGEQKHIWILGHHFELSKESKDMVHSPNHYSVFDGVEAIEIIAKSLTVEEFRGYCFGNLLKYRLRCGKKDDVHQELSKADKYKELYEKYKYLCRGE